MECAGGCKGPKPLLLDEQPTPQRTSRLDNYLQVSGEYFMLLCCLGNDVWQGAREYVSRRYRESGGRRDVQSP